MRSSRVLAFSWRQVLALSLIWLTGLVGLSVSLPGYGRAEEFADGAFRQVWGRSDAVVAEGKIQRSWLWGPQPGKIQSEAYKESPDGVRLVQYFDKSRMEINNSGADKNSPWYVTNGLLTVELVTGRVQLGDNLFEDRLPSNIGVGGDPDNSGPTYTSFSHLISLNGSNRVEQKTSLPVQEQIARDGKVNQDVPAELARLAKYSYFEPGLGHNIPDVFWNWMQKLDERWDYAMGLPISEAYWARFTVGGVERDLLVQLFERRVLTYNPANAPQWQVEMGNIGQHYYTWRYGSGPVPSPTPVPGSPTTGVPVASTTPVSGTGGTPTSTAVPGSTTPPNSATPTITTAPLELNEEEKTFLNLVDQYRTQNNRSALRRDDRLQRAARWHSDDMAKNNYFSVIDSLKRDTYKRLWDFSYTDSVQNGTIIAGLEAAGAVNFWKDNPAYRTILLDSAYKAIGAGYSFNASTQYRHYWSVNLGGS